jgi:hypothetical protein
MKHSKSPINKYVPWKYFVLSVFFGCMRLQSLVGLLMIIFWVVCGLMLGRYLHMQWGIIGYCIGFVGGFTISSIPTWAIFGKRKKQ